jgi:hypothetical protein
VRLAIALIMLPLSATAFAQTMDSENTRKTMQKLGRCVAIEKMNQVEEFLQHPDAAMKDWLRFRVSVCRISAGAGYMEGKTEALRFALAEAFLIRKFRGEVPPISGFPEKFDASADVLDVFGTCIVQKSPYESWQLLRTGAASRQENAAFNALMPTMKFCVAKGSTVRLNKFFVRGAIASAFFRYSQHAAVSQGMA